MRVRLFEGLRNVGRAGALRDIYAGITLATMNIPQVMGYTRIAGTHVVTGLYTVLLPLVAFAVFGSSRHLVVAADSATAAIFADGLAGMAPPASDKYMALVGVVALITAGLLLLARIFRLGFLADFLARTVLVGFLAGVGIQVSIAMLPDMLGLTTPELRPIEKLWHLLGHLSQAHGPTLGLAACIAGMVLAGRRYAPRLPLPLFATIASIGASYAWDFAGRGIALIGPVAGGLPSISLPRIAWHEVPPLLPIAASCFVMIIAQSAAAARAFAARNNERVDADADILGLCAANASAALSGTFVVNGSPTQTAMAERAGAHSQVAQLAFAAVVVLVLMFLTAPLQFLPRAVLAAIVFTVAVGLIDVAGLRAIRRESPGEFMLALVTATVVALIGVLLGIVLAMVLSLLRHVRHSYRPHTAVLAPDPTGRWAPVPATSGVVTEPGLVVFRFGADLFYANDSRFADTVRMLVDKAPTPIRWFVVDANAITDIDYSAARTVRDLADELNRRGVALIFARVSPFLRTDMDRHLLTAAIGPSRIFSTLHEALDSLHAAQPAG